MASDDVEAKEALTKLRKLYKDFGIDEADVVVALGGDGFMLQTLKKNRFTKKLFYGINSGNYGFLMNKFSSKNIIKNLKGAKMISISPLEMTVKNFNNQIILYIAVHLTFVLSGVLLAYMDSLIIKGKKK